MDVIGSEKERNVNDIPYACIKPLGPLHPKNKQKTKTKNTRSNLCFLEPNKHTEHSQPFTNTHLSLWREQQVFVILFSAMKKRHWGLIGVVAIVLLTLIHFNHMSAVEQESIAAHGSFMHHCLSLADPPYAIFLSLSWLLAQHLQRHILLFLLCAFMMIVADPLREWAADKAASQKARIEDAATKKESADVSAQMRPKDALDIPRQATIRAAFVKAYSLYTANCYGKDEVLPDNTPATCRDSVYLAETLISSLDTLHLMDLDAEYKRAHEYIEKDFTVDQDQSTSVHQAATRTMASLLATFDWTHECLYMKKARGTACCDVRVPGVFM
jgi:hypothetical protein